METRQSGNKGYRQMVQCEKGHSYDPAIHTSCPLCGITGIENEIKTRPLAHQDDFADNKDPGHTMPGGRANEGATVGFYAKNLKIDPVVGWLVCIEGKDRGRDYRIRSERNFIGRDPQMDICIKGDNSISRMNHAIISFNPKKCRFSLLPGDGRGLVYLNDDEVSVPAELKSFDVIELGDTKLMFIPFCGDHFKWE